MRKEQFITTFAAALVVCMLVAGYAAMTATYSAAEAPPVPAEYLAEVLTASDPGADADPDSLGGKLHQVQSTVQAGISEVVTAFATDESYAGRIAKDCGETGLSWQALDLTGGEKIYLAQGSMAVLRKGTATCIESASIGLTDCQIGRTLEEGDELRTGTLYQATVPAAGLHVLGSCTVILSGDYSLS